eukprot:7245674-Lingulodinium_polyedra.AAC.1
MLPSPLAWAAAGVAGVVGTAGGAGGVRRLLRPASARQRPRAISQTTFMHVDGRTYEIHLKSRADQ